ncbi:MAG: hypothetical protein NZ989_08055 [Bacteroidia bacterium]|nr:hypothetical protein [Bacteroidia bacterium]MDW8058326.1 hypothetical protein [Bacteroidia bacterium]
MDRVFERLFDLYDFIANIIPGYLFLQLIHRCLLKIGIKAEWLSVMDELTVRGVLVLLMLAYVAGMLLHSASHILWGYVERKGNMIEVLFGEASSNNLLGCGSYPPLSPSYKQRLAQTFRNYFALRSSLESDETQEPLSHRETFELMYRSLQNRPSILTIQIARYGFYRVLFVVGVLGGMAELTLIAFAPQREWEISILAIMAYLVIAWTSFCGYKRRSYESAKMVCDLFLIEKEKDSLKT